MDRWKRLRLAACLALMIALGIAALIGWWRGPRALLSYEQPNPWLVRERSVDPIYEIQASSGWSLKPRETEQP